MKRKKRFLFPIWCLMVFALFSVTTAEDPAAAADAAAEPLRLPTANTALDNLVPYGEVVRIAVNKARELWGTVTPGEPIACSDDNGDIVVYMCPFKIGGGPFPSYAQMMEGVREGRRLLEQAKRGVSVQEPAGAGGDAGSGLDSSPVEAEALSESLAESEVPVGIAPRPPTERANFQEAFKKAKGKEMGIGEYGTIYVSARYDQYPIPLCSHYLSPYYFTGDLAREKAKAALGGSPELCRYYFLGRRGQYFEFVSGEKKAVVHAYSLEVKPFEPLELGKPTEEEQQDMFQEWEKITQTR
jgi:hypothetical protein